MQRWASCSSWVRSRRCRPEPRTPGATKPNRAARISACSTRARGSARTATSTSGSRSTARPTERSSSSRCTAPSAVARPSPTASTGRTSAPPCGRSRRSYPSMPCRARSDGSIPLTFPVTTSNPPPLGIRVDGQGVFPVLVSLLDADDNELDQFVTHLVRLPTADTSARPLAFSLIVPFAAPPGFQPDGQARLPEADATRLRRSRPRGGGEPDRPPVARPGPRNRRLRVQHGRGRDDSRLLTVAGAQRAAGAR